MSKLVSLFSLTLCALTLTTVEAQPRAQAFLKKRHAQVQRILQRPANSDEARKRRNGQLDRALGDLLDVEELSKRALSEHWEGLNDEQRQEFTELLEALVQRSYRRNLQSTLDYRVSYLGESRRGDDGVVVRTLARSRENRRAPEVSIDYALTKSDSNWRVYDIVTDGVSLVDNYRNQFNRIIRKDGWNELIDRMKKKLEDG